MYCSCFILFIYFWKREREGREGERERERGERERERERERESPLCPDHMINQQFLQSISHGECESLETNSFPGKVSCVFLWMCDVYVMPGDGIQQHSFFCHVILSYATRLEQLTRVCFSMHFKILVFNYYFLTKVFENVFVNSFLHIDNDPMLTFTVTLNLCIACRRCWCAFVRDSGQRLVWTCSS